MNAFEYGEISEQQAESGKPYLQFLNEGTMSLGLYVLAAGSSDTQTPHAEDEIYYVVAGRGTIAVAGRSLDPGFLRPGARTLINREHQPDDERFGASIA
jgi:mannose-6-phosphate isomerase-like protein (cupin superfamily)